jgi:hypothetical protein
MDGMKIKYPAQAMQKMGMGGKKISLSALMKARKR